MKYGLAFSLLGGAQIALAIQVGWFFGWLVAWSGVSFILVAAAYLGVGARVFGKRSNGTMAWPNVALLLPFLLLTWGLWEIQRRLASKPAVHEVAPGVWLGRRLVAGELPPGVGLIVDLTAEFPEMADVRQGRDYLCLPTLDAVASEASAFAGAVARVAAFPAPVLIHCALGHGRSATLAAAVLLAKGVAGDAADAEAILNRARSGVRLNSSQRALLRRVAEKEEGCQ